MLLNNFWRTEVWHPLSVHFPVALLLIATLTLFISFFIRSNYKMHWRNTAGALLFVGTIAAWIGIYTGNLADGVVARKICDPTVLKDHEIAALTMAYLFTMATAFSVLLFLKRLKPNLQAISYYILLVLMFIGSAYLVRASHLGATLVYEQGAGVKNHSVDCDEYE